MSTTLYGTMRPRGADQHQPGTSIEATADTYDQAYAALGAQVPDGWQLLGISPWPA